MTPLMVGYGCVLGYVFDALAYRSALVPLIVRLRIFL
jgi:hypothetical protein